MLFHCQIKDQVGNDYGRPKDVVGESRMAFTSLADTAFDVCFENQLIGRGKPPPSSASQTRQPFPAFPPSSVISPSSPRILTPSFPSPQYPPATSPATSSSTSTSARTHAIGRPCRRPRS